MLSLSRRFSSAVFTVAAARTLTLLPGALLLLPLAAPPTAAFAAVAPDTVTGTVVGPDGKPVAGATVYFTALRDKGTLLPSGSTKTNAEGVFRVDLEPAALPPADAKRYDFKVYGIATVIAPGLGVQQRILTSRPNRNVVTLAAGCTVTGTVLEEKQKPLAGTKVILKEWTAPGGRPSSEDWMDRQLLITVPGLPEGALSATTGADGKWTMRDLPGAGSAVFSASSSTEVMVANRNPEAALQTGKTVALDAIVMQPGAGFTGRVVYGDSGKPAKDIRVEAFARNIGTVGSAVTGDDGTYRLEGLGPGTFTISVTAAEEKWVSPPRLGVEGVARKMTPVGEIALTPALILEGTVTDDETGKPVKGVAVLMELPGGGDNAPSKSTETDANGQFRLYAPPGKAQVVLGNIPDTYLDTGDYRKAVDLRPGDTDRLAFTLKKGLIAQGTVVGDDGKPVSGVHVRVLGQGDYDWSSGNNSGDDRRPKSDAGGKWRFAGLAKNDKGYRVAVDPEWEVVSPKQFTLGDTNAAPLVVTLKRRAVLTLSGRVVSTTGEPLAGTGVSLYATVQSPEGRTPTQRNETLQTDKDGAYRLANVRPDEEVKVSPYREGYKYRSGGIQTKSDGAISVSDFVLVPLTGKISGQVLRRGAAGKPVPVPGAYVWSLDGSEQATAVTDSAGRFTLANIPEGPVKVTAAAGRVFMTVTAPAATGPLVVTFPAAAPRPPVSAAKPEATKARLRETLQAMATEIKGKPGADRSFVVSLLARDDPDAAYSLALSCHKDGIVPDGVVATIIEERAKVDPPSAAAWGGPRIAEMKYGVVKCRVDGELALALAPTQPAQAARFFAAGVADGGDGNALTINRGRLVAAAALLRNGEAQKQLALLVEALKAPTAKNERARSALQVARGSLALADSMVGEYTTRERIEYYGAMARRLVKTNPADAERYLARLLSIQTEIAGDKGKADGETPQNLGTLRWYIPEILVKVVPAIGAGNPARALALARSYPLSPDTRNDKWLALGLAARVQSRTDAPAVWQEAALLATERDWDTAPKLARLAALAATSPTAGTTTAADLWKKAKAAGERQNFNSGDRETFVFHAARFDPGLARMLTERGLEMYSGSGPGQIVSPYQTVLTLIAFSAVDPDEARTRLADLPATDNTLDNGSSGLFSLKNSGRLSMLRWLSLTDEQRTVYSVNDILSLAWED